MKTYRVIRRDDIGALEEAVNAYIRQGWELAGGIAFVMVSDGDPPISAQAIWRDEDVGTLGKTENQS